MQGHTPIFFSENQASVIFMAFHDRLKKEMKEKYYRDWVRCEDLVKSVVSCGETDICIMGDRDLSQEAFEAIDRYRKEIEEYIEAEPLFRDSLTPVRKKRRRKLTPIVSRMIEAGRAAGVGPMAAVAGAVSEFVGNELLKFSKELIVENGGDIFISSLKNRKFGVFAGGSPLTGKFTFEIVAADTPLGVCTSSGTVGPSLSFGGADAACIVSKDTALADAAATKLGNMVKRAHDIEKGIEMAKAIPGILGGFVIVGSKFGIWGKVRLA